MYKLKWTDMYTDVLRKYITYKSVTIRDIMNRGG